MGFNLLYRRRLSTQGFCDAREKDRAAVQVELHALGIHSDTERLVKIFAIITEPQNSQLTRMKSAGPGQAAYGVESLRACHL
jgi:hypothetical protein